MGLGAGGLDMQEIRKSFFLLDFPKRERRERAVNHWSTNIPRDREGQATDAKGHGGQCQDGTPRPPGTHRTCPAQARGSKPRRSS